jgi:DNA/RNA-binding domain of Phe-tRNA-synthetase-like protein
VDLFGYDPAVLARYPSVVGGAVLARGVANGPSAPDLQRRFEDEQRWVIARIGATPLSDIPSLAAWRKAFRGFGVDPTQYRGAAEALLRRLTKSGEVPSIGTLVDIGNLVSIRHAIPTAVFDLDRLKPPVRVRFADGSEDFHDIGQSTSVHPEPGEVVFVDTANVVVARRWCWRQSEAGAARHDTVNVVITTEAHHQQARADVEAALRDLQDLLADYAGGTLSNAILDARSPTFSSSPSGEGEAK